MLKKLMIIAIVACALTTCKSNKTTIQNDITTRTAVEKYGQLSIEDGVVTDQNNNPVQLRGMSLFWSNWEGKFYNKGVVKTLKNDWNCSIVRATLGIQRGGYLERPEQELKKIKAVIDAAIEEGIYVIVDWHDHHGEDHLKESIAFFTEIAKTYGNYPNIIYETYNEPLDVSWTTILKPHHEAIIKEIRKYDKNNLIVCGTRNWAQEVHEVVGNRIDDKNVAYTLHYYAASHKQELRDKALLAIKNKIPLFVTEYGITSANGDGEINEEESNIWWDFMEKHNLSWCAWSISDKRELSSTLLPGANKNGNWPENKISTSGKIIRKELKSKD